MSKSKITLVPVPSATGYPATTRPAVYSSPVDGEAPFVMLVKIGPGETFVPIEAASEGTLEGIRLLLAIGKPQPVTGGHFVLDLTNNIVTDLSAVAGGVPVDATGVELILEAGDLDRIRITKDGSNPTSSKGFLWRNSGSEESSLILSFQSRAILEQVKLLLFGDPIGNGAIIQGQFTKAAI